MASEVHHMTTYSTTCIHHHATGLIYGDSFREYARNLTGDLIYRPRDAESPWLLADEIEVAREYPELDLSALPIVDDTDE